MNGLAGPRVTGLRRRTSAIRYVPFLVFSRRLGLARQQAESELETYWSKVRATMEGRPTKVLAAYGPVVTLECPEVEGNVVA